MSGFVGFCQLGSTIDVPVVSINTSLAPTDADSAPTYRIYGPAGFLASGTLPFKETGTIIAATSASPTVYTSAGHNLTVGMAVTITGITVSAGSATNFNVTDAQITAVTTNTFTIATNNTSNTYSSGGIWHTVGLYDFNYTVLIGNNFASGQQYFVDVYGLFSTVLTQIDSFVFAVT